VIYTVKVMALRGHSYTLIAGTFDGRLILESAWLLDSKLIEQPTKRFEADNECAVSWRSKEVGGRAYLTRPQKQWDDFRR
jgi:hypothetical protein